MIGNVLVASSDPGTTFSVTSSSEQTISITSGFAVAPTGRVLTLFADRTHDPDGAIEDLDFTWSLENSRGEKNQTCVTEPGAEPNGSEGCKRRSWDVTLDFPGVYLARLDVTDDQKCLRLRKWLFGTAGCRKTATATIFLKATAYEEPILIVQPYRPEVKQGDTITIDAGRSRTFDYRPPRFVWSVDDVEFSDKAEFRYETSEYDNSELSVSVVAIDQFSERAMRDFTIRIDQPKRILVSANDQGGQSFFKRANLAQ